MLSVTVKIGPRRSRGVQHGGGRLGRPINRLHRNSENSRTEIFETRTCPPVFRQIWHRRSQRFYAALMSLFDPSDAIAVLAFQSHCDHAPWSGGCYSYNQILEATVTGLRRPGLGSCDVTPVLKMSCTTASGSPGMSHCGLTSRHNGTRLLSEPLTKLLRRIRIA